MVCAVDRTAGSAVVRLGGRASPGGPSWPPGPIPGPHARLPPDSDVPPADASDLQGRQLLAGLDKVASDLDRQEKAITAILRPPLEQGRAVQDSAERAKDLKVPPGLGHGQNPWLSGAPAQGPSPTGVLVLNRDHLPRLTREFLSHGGGLCEAKNQGGA